MTPERKLHEAPDPDIDAVLSCLTQPESACTSLFFGIGDGYCYSEAEILRILNEPGMTTDDVRRHVAEGRSLLQKAGINL